MCLFFHHIQLFHISDIECSYFHAKPPEMIHPIDLESQSIWTTPTMDLYVLNADDGDLDYIQDRGFSAKRQIVYSEERVNKVIFCTCQSEKQDHGATY